MERPRELLNRVVCAGRDSSGWIEGVGALLEDGIHQTVHGVVGERLGHGLAVIDACDEVVSLVIVVGAILGKGGGAAGENGLNAVNSPLGSVGAFGFDAVAEKRARRLAKRVGLDAGPECKP